MQSPCVQHLIVSAAASPYNEVSGRHRQRVNMMDVGTEFGHYRVVEHIGRGGMADVWSARDLRLQRTVAVKTISPDLSLNNDPIMLFEREARTIAALEHPHILPIYEFGDYQNQLYIVMRYVSGGALDKIVESGPLPRAEVVRYASAVAQALDYAHQKKVVHLDLKPSNILLDSNRAPYLADFGLASVMGPEGRAQNPGSGTLLYMAPEQLLSDELDHRADIYSFTILLFHMLTGNLPFDALVPVSLKQIQEKENLPTLKSLGYDFPDDLDWIMQRSTAVEADDRPDRVMDVMDEVQRILQPTSTQSMTMTLDLTRDHAELVDLAPGDQAVREAQDLYQRARRAWAHGQGRFLLGVTHFMLVSDYYIEARQHDLDLDEAGMQMLLRGALEYDHEIDFWWGKLDADSRRLVALHAMRSDSPPTRARALDRLHHLPDTDMAAIPRQIARLLQVEGDERVLLAALGALEARSRLPKPKPRALATDITGDQLDPGASPVAEALSQIHITMGTPGLSAGRVAAMPTDTLGDAARQVQPAPSPSPAPESNGTIDLNLDSSLPAERIDLGTIEITPEDIAAASAELNTADRPVVTQPVTQDHEPVPNRADSPTDTLPQNQPEPPPATPTEPERAAASRPLRTTELISRLSSQLQLTAANVWRDIIFNQEIDLLLADLALTAPNAPVRERAARTIGRIYSLAAVRRLAREQKSGTPGALRALAFIRDEAPSLPREVSGQARLYAWLANTWRRITDDPMQLIQRFLLAVLGGFLAIGLNTYITFRSEAIFTPQRWGNTIAIGLTVGVLVGLLVLLADEIPSRLRGFWLWWARLILSAGLGFAAGLLVWSGYTYLFLQQPVVAWYPLYLAGAGIALGFVATAVLKLPGWLAVIVTAGATYVPLYLAFTQWLPPVLYYDSPNQIYTLGGMVAVLIALGGHGAALLRNIRWLLNRRR